MITDFTKEHAERKKKNCLYLIGFITVNAVTEWTVM